jgi:hypothetical protein
VVFEFFGWSDIEAEETTPVVSKFKAEIWEYGVKPSEVTPYLNLNGAVFWYVDYGSEDAVCDKYILFRSPTESSLS